MIHAIIMTITIMALQYLKNQIWIVENLGSSLVDSPRTLCNDNSKSPNKEGSASAYSKEVGYVSVEIVRDNIIEFEKKHHQIRFGMRCSRIVSGNIKMR